MPFKKLRDALRGSRGGIDEDYLEIDLEQEKKENKVVVKLFSLKHYEDVTAVLNALREGYTIAMIDIKTLKQKDPIEMKRAISKVKKTAEAIEGSIAGFGENVVIVTPSFATIQKEPDRAPKEEKKFDDYY